uniref:C2H2-type domain-containing protein n=1 Tax=Anopheles culicifacies TaxID=139723 RepID=A0A182MCU3_9DIPT
MEVPSMVRRSGGKLIVRQVVSGEQLVVLNECIKTEPDPESQLIDGDSRQGSDNATHPDDIDPKQQQPGSKAAPLLPQCKIKRNYSCRSCDYFTQNPRSYLTHLRDTHGEKISVNECKRCLYASRHHQKLARHMRMVHGVTAVSSKVSTAGKRDRKFIKKECPNKQQSKGVHGGGSVGTIETKILDALSSAYAQQLVASLLPSLEFWSSSVTDTNIDLLKSTFKREMDDLQHVLKSPDQVNLTHRTVLWIPNKLPLFQNSNTKVMEKNVRKSSEDNEVTPRKRARPIPNLIPLAPSTPVPTRPEKELLKPVPMSVLMPPDVASKSSGSPASPMRLASPQTKCTFCELSFESTIDLANHIATSHKEDLITSLLQKSIDDSNQNIFPQSDTDSASNELWKSLLEVNNSAFGTDPAPRAGSESDGKTTTSKEYDDVEILENKSETYCGVETAPGYGEVTSKLTTTDPNATGLMKKVFKCPHCSFWASTASRFHVHIVGHLNKKPFECSLCSYRSNWRWDITKHIRLKTIRDPSHKNAGVLMNDETGRRNYTKYNKYITLMQITDHSTKESTSYGKSFAESSMTDLMTACSAYNIDLKALATIPGFNLLLEDKQIPDETSIGLKMDEVNSHFKCQFCDHRTTTKADLMLHIANAHSGLSTSLQQLEDAMEQEAHCNTTTQQQQQSKSSTTNNVSTPSSTPTPPATSFGSLSKSAANTSNDDSPTNGTLLTGSGGAGDKTNPPEHAGGDRAGDGEGSSQRMAMPTTWRHNAPYRCGHCHQVSNWKHVIQRHCRLKHNGHVFIEHVNSEKDDPADGDGQQMQRNNKPNQHSVYVIEDVLHQATDQTRKSIEALVASSIPPPLAPFSMDDVSCPANTLEPIVEILDKDPADMINFNGSIMPSTVLVDSGTVAPAVSSEQLECISCQFRAETVEQLTEHLEQHMGNSQNGTSGNYDPSGLLDPLPTTMYYCPRCPARFFHEIHILEHEAKHSTGARSDGKSCSFCTFTTTDDDERGRHEEVHSPAYNINTDNLQIFLAESKEYPKPQLTLKESNGEQLFYVDMPIGNGQTSRTPEITTPSRKSKKSKSRVRTPESSTHGEEEQPVSSIFLCEYCDQTFDVESDMNAHVRTHFSSILAPQQGVSYYTSLSNTLDKEKKLELIVSGAQSTMALHYVYDNARKKDWNVYSKAESVLLKF